MEDMNWSMYGTKIDMIELWLEKACGAQDILNIMYNTCGPSTKTNGLRCVEKHILTHIGIKGPFLGYTYWQMVW